MPLLHFGHTGKEDKSTSELSIGRFRVLIRYRANYIWHHLTRVYLFIKAKLINQQL